MQTIIDHLPQLLDGAWLTIQITALSVIIGLCLAVPLAMLRLSTWRAVRWPVHAFIFFFRGTPLLVQLFLIYYGSGQFNDALESVGLWQFFRQAYFCGVLTLTLNTAAYTAEILRGALQTVPHGEVEAARACGMRGLLLYRRIMFPKAFRIAWPAYTNEVIFLLQATSLVSIITLMDITGVAQAAASRTFAFYEMYLTAAAMYLVLVYALLFVFKRIEYRLTGHLRPARVSPEPTAPEPVAPEPVPATQGASEHGRTP
ncbi:amino acid ABC transporter membrane protein 2, PAAT family [Limimonas halophila]|uniref:Amino acid ABC transporter membrane protein 2, PAAT family n=1 Tax=Limimonas halophila TaxID=1082479 RepID=A0A1G7RLZ6_9PROT|nr:ABC transporter permease [Limimonas halophila]SDG11791.1 amino acid ABC transporter membrane protein 2, PAAT family [Limimonas halophila]